MPTIQLPDTAFNELKRIAEPFVDTPESLISKLIHEEVLRRHESNHQNGTDVSPRQRILDPNSRGNLKFTKITSAYIDSEPISRAKWNSVRERVHIIAYDRLGSFEALKDASEANLRRGRYEESGYKYVLECDFSIQGVDANLAWEQSFQLTQRLGIPIRIEFEWRDKEGAAFPGEIGVLEWSPTC